MSFLGRLVFVLAALCPLPAAAESYCHAGSDALAARLLHDRSPDPALLYDNCQVGDSVVLPGATAELVAIVCDFSRSIAILDRGSLGASVACILGPRRDVRTKRPAAPGGR